MLLRSSLAKILGSPCTGRVRILVEVRTGSQPNRREVDRGLAKAASAIGGGGGMLSVGGAYDGKN